MSSTTLVSVSEYLETSYRPDVEYVDGELLERNVGEWDHGQLQLLLLLHLARYRHEGFFVAPEQRVQVKASRFRVPDVCLVRGNPGEQILTHAPLLAIEILSPKDSMSSMHERIDDYLAFGIENVWIFDSRRKKAYWADAAGIHEAVNGVLETAGAPIILPLATLWA